MPKKEEIVGSLVKQLDLARQIRASLINDPRTAARRKALREWQAARLARSYADLLASKRFGGTAAFFLSDIYGPKDLSHHEDDIRRVLPVMKRTLPAGALETVANAVELNALSERLDAEMLRVLGSKANHMTAADYAMAYRKVGCRAGRERQIELIGEIGRSLERLTRTRLIGAALSAMRQPARLGGLGELQDFLDRGYKAFRKMGSANKFLRTIVERERQLMEALLNGDDHLLPV
jgi:hypothetical protein